MVLGIASWRNHARTVVLVSTARTWLVIVCGRYCIGFGGWRRLVQCVQDYAGASILFSVARIIATHYSLF